MVKRLSARQLNRATLDRQMLLQRVALPVGDAVDRIVAIQAQEPASPYIALWARLDGFDPADLDHAFATHDLEKASLLRITLHAVTARDYPAFHLAMQPSLRAARYLDRRFTNEGVPVAEVEALVPELRGFADRGRTNQEVEAWLADRFGTAKPRIWWALRHVGPFVHAPTGGAWSFGPRPSYVAARVPETTLDPNEAVRTLVRRSLQGFGPASMQDIAQFGTIYRPPIKDALASMGDELVRYEGPDGTPLLDVRGGVIPDEDTPAPPRLMAMWDSVLLAYRDRSRTVPPAYRSLVMRSNGDVLATVLVDGLVAGVWRPTDAGIEVTTFEGLDDDTWAGIEDEARRLVTFLGDREPIVYRRYGHWFDELPAAEVRVLGA